MAAFTAAGMLYNLFRQCQQGNVKSCSPTDIYKCSSKGNGSNRTCKQINWEVPLRIMNSFFPIINQKYRRQLEQHNREYGYKVRERI